MVHLPKLTLPKLTLPKPTLPVLLAGVVLALLPLAPAQAAPLNPNNFASLGANPFTQPGTYTVDTAGSAPTLTGPGLTAPLHGVVSGGEAVFDFDTLRLPYGATLVGVRDSGSRPLALLARGDITLDGVVDVSGAGDGGNFSANGYAAGPGGGGGGGGGVRVNPAGAGGPGFVNGGNGDSFGDGGNGGSVSPGGGGGEGAGGAFGGSGGNGAFNGEPGGQAYGNLAASLQGGSGGVGSGGSGGGGGGGAVEVDSGGVLRITGTLTAAGGGVSDVDVGGGAGGGILLSGGRVALAAACRITAQGGASSSRGGGGGGGRILLVSASSVAYVPVSLSVAGGSGGSGGGDGGPGVLTVSGTATAPLGVPTANAHTLTVPLDTSVADTLTGSDPNSPPRSLTYLLYSLPAHGTLSGTLPDLTYTPAAGYTGPDSFAFQVNNGEFDSLPATVSITVVGAPTANAQSVAVAFNTAKAITLTGTDPDSPPLALTYTVVTGPAHGTLTGTGPNLAYTPTANYQGADSFTFNTNNGTNTSSTATVTISVAAGTPTANAQSVTTSQGTAAAITLAGSDPDVPALPLAYTVATGPTHGTLTGTAPSLTYTPAAGYYGADSFTFTVSNGVNTSAQATVSLTVTQAAASDVTAQVTVTRGGFRYVRATGHYLQPVTLANNGAALADPISLVLDGLAGATLVGASGTTSAAAPSGSPYVTLPAGGLAAGASVTVTLEFTAQPTGYTARVLAGPGAR